RAVDAQPHPVPATARADDGGAARLPAARAHRDGALRALAVHPAGARLLSADRLPLPAVHRLSLARRRTRRTAGTARVGADGAARATLAEQGAALTCPTRVEEGAQRPSRNPPCATRVSRR